MASNEAWFEDVQSYYWIHNIVHLHRDLNMWLIRWDGDRFLNWMELNISGQQIQPFQFEIFYGKEHVRDEYYLANMQKAAQEGRLVVGSLHGFHDLFYPVVADEKRRTFFQAGQFLTETPSWQSLASAWHQITGREAASANPDFVRFVKMALQLPIVTPPVVAGFERFFDYYAQYLTRQESTERLHEAVDALRREVFVQHWPNIDWVQQCVSSEKFRLTPWYHEGRLADWMKEEMKICRLPTTVLALMPLDAPDEQLDTVQTMVRNYRLQRELIEFSFGMPQTAAHRLGDYGAFFVTSADPKKSPVAARAELRDRARQLQEHVRREHGLRSVVGIGSSVPPGEDLYRSYVEAVHALHLCVQLEKDTLFFDEKFGAEHATVRYADLHRTAEELTDAFDRASQEQIKLASDQYVRRVLVYSSERLEVVRSQFLTTLFRLIGNVQKRHSIRPQAVDQLAEELAQKLEEASSVYQLIESFKDVLTRLTFYVSRALEGPKSIRLAATLQYLQDNYGEPLRLPDVARKAGFSVPAFSRVFRQATGTSFLNYLRNIRVEQAKVLLRTTTLPTAQIAISCGFQSPHHLIRSFKKVTGQTPGDYRRWAQQRKEGRRQSA